MNRHGVPIESIQQLRAKVQSLGESAAEVVGTTDPAAQMQKSLNHKQLVDEYDKQLNDLLKAVSDLPGFTAALERSMRAAFGGGSVASDLFIGETLQDIAIDGKTAWAVRRTSSGYCQDLKFSQQPSSGYCQDLKFSQQRGQWRIHLLAQGRRRG